MNSREWKETVAEIQAEAPEIIERDRLTQEAAKEQSISGQLRRAVIAGQRNYGALSNVTGLDPIAISEFTSGRKTLDSDAFSRLASACNLHLASTP